MSCWRHENCCDCLPLRAVCCQSNGATSLHCRQTGGASHERTTCGMRRQLHLRNRLSLPPPWQCWCRSLCPTKRGKGRGRKGEQWSEAAHNGGGSGQCGCPSNSAVKTRRRAQPHPGCRSYCCWCAHVSNSVAHSNFCASLSHKRTSNLNCTLAACLSSAHKQWRLEPRSRERERKCRSLQVYPRAHSMGDANAPLSTPSRNKPVSRGRDAKEFRRVDRRFISRKQLTNTQASNRISRLKIGAPVAREPSSSHANSSGFPGHTEQA